MRQTDGKHGFSLVTVHRNRAAVEVSHPLGDDKAHAVALGGMGMIGLIELVESAFVLLPGDVRAEILGKPDGVVRHKWAKKNLVFSREFGAHTVSANRELPQQVWIKRLAVFIGEDGIALGLR